MIAVTGVLAIWLVQSPNDNARNVAPFLGLLGQPFWMYATFVAEQWGIFALTFFYTIAWARGAWRVYTTYVYRKNLSGLLAGSSGETDNNRNRTATVAMSDVHR